MQLSSLRIGTTTLDPSVFAAGHLTSRQADDVIYYDDPYYSFWYTRTGIIVKWSLFWGLLLLFTAYMVGGYMHAKKRIARGLPPLAYHRWLVPRRMLAPVDPRYAYPAPAPQYSAYHQNGEYPMYPMPPPTYDPSRPPMYPGGPAPAGAAAPVKNDTDPSQTYRP